MLNNTNKEEDLFFGALLSLHCAILSFLV